MSEAWTGYTKIVPKCEGMCVTCPAIHWELRIEFYTKALNWKVVVERIEKKKILCCGFEY